MVAIAEFLSPGIMNLDTFPVDDNMAAWALEYLYNHRAEALRYERRGKEEWYIGWGGRAVVLGPKGLRLRSFRRFEYSVLEEHRGKPIHIFQTFKKFRDRAVANRENQR